MGLWQKLKDGFGKLIGANDIQQVSPRTVESILKAIWQRPESGTKSEEAMLAAFHEVSAFRNPVHQLALDVSTNPWQVLKNGEPLEKHPVIDLLTKPNERHDYQQFAYLFAAWTTITGDFHAPFLAPNDEVGLYPVAPHKVARGRTPFTWEYTIGSNRLTNVKDELTLTSANLNLMSPYGEGRGVGYVISDAIEIIEYSYEFEKSVFYNYAMPPAIIQLPDAGEDEMKVLKHQWMEEHQGTQKQNKPLFTSRPDMEVFESSLNLKDTLTPEHRKDAAEDIRKALGITPAVLGDVEDTNLATAKEEQKIYQSTSVKPVLVQLKSMIENQLFPKFQDGDDLEFWFENPVEEDVELKKFVLEHAETALTENDKRALAGYPELEGLDVIIRKNEKKIQVIEPGPPKDGGQTMQQAAGDQTKQLCDHDLGPYSSQKKSLKLADS